MGKYVVQECFTDELGFTFKKAHNAEKNCYLYFMIKDNSLSVFDLIEKDNYDIAHHQFKEYFMKKLQRRAIKTEKI
jgi:hypothetical protein